MLRRLVFPASNQLAEEAYDLFSPRSKQKRLFG